MRDVGEVVLNPTDRPLAASRLAELARDCAVVVSDRHAPFDAALLDAIPSLVAVLRCAMDIRNIDLAAADRCGILVTRASAGFVDAVAELALGFMIDLGRGISGATLAYRTGAAPAIRPGRQLAGSRVGIVGLGAIGRRLGALCRAVGMDVAASDPAPFDVPGIRPMELPALLARSDFVVCLAPALPATRHMMGAAAFAAMPAGSVFLNLSRGSLVDEDALEAALESGHLAGAALDVGSAPDEMPPPRLARRPDVIATPHIGGLTPAATAHQAFETVRQVAALAEGRMPEGAVNPGRAARLARLGIAVPPA